MVIYAFLTYGFCYTIFLKLYAIWLNSLSPPILITLPPPNISEEIDYLPLVILRIRLSIDRFAVALAIGASTKVRLGS